MKPLCNVSQSEGEKLCSSLEKSVKNSMPEDMKKVLSSSASDVMMELEDSNFPCEDGVMKSELISLNKATKSDVKMLSFLAGSDKIKVIIVILNPLLFH